MFEAVQEKINQFLWNTESRPVTRFQTHLLQALRIFYGVARDLRGGLPSLRAMSLVYTTLLSMVPLLAVSFSVLKGFGVHNQLEPALNNILEPLGEKGLQISQQIIGFVDQINVRMLGAIGLLLLIFTVLMLVKKIESAFNYSWRISTTRNLIQRFSNYLSVILLGPLLLFASAGLTASFNSSTVVNKIQSIEAFGSMILLLGETVPYLLTIISFTFIFVLVPNTKVKISSALYGAVISTILWKISGSIFTAFIVDSTNYTAIYSGFAILIIFMIWIYISWLILLTGSSISYYHQNPDCIHEKSQIIHLSCRLREKLALTIMQLIAYNFHHNQAMWTTKSLAKITGLSVQAVDIIVTGLISHKLLIITGSDNQHFLPGQSLENIPLDKVLSAARSAEESDNLKPDDVETAPQVKLVINDIENAISDATKNTTMKDLV